MSYIFSDDRSRMLSDAPPLVFAAAYERVEAEPPTVRYQHIGIFDEKHAALRWLQCGEPKPTRIKVERQ